MIAECNTAVTLVMKQNRRTNKLYISLFFYYLLK